MMEIVILVHGGAGDITDSRVAGKLVGVKKAVRDGYKILADGGNVLDAVEAAVASMELDDSFNAGYGSVLNLDGDVEMEASIMHGKDLKAGCVTLIREILHPIKVARRVMKKTNHTFLGGENAMKFAYEQQFKILPRGALVTENAKTALEEFKRKKELGRNTTFARTELGTVGAVAIDADGNIAVATSTGGITGKVPGRIGDTPILGSGTYADNKIGGVSTTGHGETLMRFNLAQRILQNIKYTGASAQEATKASVTEMTERLTGTGGAITIDRLGQIGIHFSSNRMAWAYIKGKDLHFGINPEEDNCEDFIEEIK